MNEALHHAMPSDSSAAWHLFVYSYLHWPHILKQHFHQCTTLKWLLHGKYRPHTLELSKYFLRVWNRSQLVQNYQICYFPSPGWKWRVFCVFRPPTHGCSRRSFWRVGFTTWTKVHALKSFGFQILPTKYVIVLLRLLLLNNTFRAFKMISMCL